MSSANEHAERLRAEGIDPESFLKVAQVAAEGAMGERSGEGVERLAALAREVHAAGFALYFPFESCVLPLAKVFAGQADEFLGALDDVGGIATDLGERATKTIQRGIPSVCRAAAGRPFVASGAMGLARELGRLGIDPGETLLQGVLALAEVVGKERESFEGGTAAIAAFAKALDARGVHATYPIQQGLCGAIEAWRGELSDLPEALRDLGDLVAALQDAGISPYHVLEYGVSAALPAAGPLPWLRREVFPLAVALAGQGIDPAMTLQAGVAEIAYLDEPEARAALGWAQAAADDGVDPGWFLEFALGRVCHDSENVEAFQAALGGIDDLVRAISAHGHNPANTFRDGLPEALGGADTGRLLAASTALAVQGIDPGPPLARGFGTLRYACTNRPTVSEAAMGFAERLVAQGQSPWYPLESGLPAVLLAAGSDDGRAVELLRALGELLVDLHAGGIATKDLCLYGISSLGRAARGDAALFETLLGLMHGLARDLQAAGFSPVHTVGTGMPAVCQVATGDRSFLEEAVKFARGLAKDGIDPAPFLVHAVPALCVSPVESPGKAPGETLAAAGLQQIASLAVAALAAGIAPQPIGEALAAFADLDPEASAEALTFCRDLLAEGIDMSLPIEHSVPAVLRACTGEHRPAGLLALADALREAKRRSLPFENLVDTAFGYGAETCGGDPAGLRAALTAALVAATDVAELPADLGPIFLSSASSAAATLAGASGAEKGAAAFAAALGTLTEWAVPLAKTPGLRPALAHGLTPIARASGDSADALQSLLSQLETLSPLADADTLFEHAYTPAVLAAEGDPARLSRSLRELNAIGASCGNADIYYRIGRLASLVARLPQAWSALIVPACAGGSAGAAAALQCAQGLDRYLKTPEDLVLIREIVTQYGVRAPDLLSGLILTGLHRGQIFSLGDERETILSFLGDVPFADAEYYVEYRRIMRDPELTPAARRAKVAALSGELDAIMQAVVSGEVTPEQESHALFGQVLTYVFPPARSMSRGAYLSLYRTFEDRPGDVTGLADRGPLPAPEVSLATGGYQIADGTEIDRAPWQPLLAAVQGAADGAEPEELAALGEALFAAWVEGNLGKPRTRDRLLGRIYTLHRAVGSGLPDALDDAGALLKYREFLSDTAREIVQDALAALRAAEPERYGRQVRAKLTPSRRAGKGLIRGVLRTAAAFQDGSLERDAALERLARQLRTSDLSAPGDQDALLALDSAVNPEAAASLIEGLPERAVPIVLGEEHHRVLADLVGAELAAMQRELFGEGSETGKLEYSADSGGPALGIRMELTKRRAHAPIGICEGVCTATDSRLWSTPAFLQCIFWGPENRARGGMHLLRVERTVDGKEERALLLPGINPSLELLREVGPAAILDAALGYARSVASALGLDEVWIPTHRAIATNRGPIRQVFEEREWPAKDVQRVAFSYSPYSYTVDNVWVLPS